MTDVRPDPEVLLARVTAEEVRRRRGKLRIFFGAAPGVGKTYAMLSAGRRLAKQGMDVWVGYVEPHSRPETQALVLGLEVIPRREVSHRGAKLLEFDLEAALARKPQLLLVDELAHTNAPGVTHLKRWQDVRQLIDSGIDVYTTLNVQHLESLNDEVARLTGIVVRETVPDALFDEADEIELVDVTPDGLLQRLREGKVYVPHEAQRAVQNFFIKSNLIALRELALRRSAERVGAQMEVYQEDDGVLVRRARREHLLVCVGPSPFAGRLVRATQRMARSVNASWVAVHVETPSDARISTQGRADLRAALQLAEQLGGETAELSGFRLADELISYALGHDVTRIVVGKPKQPRWREWLGGSLVYDLTRKCGDIDVYVISGDPQPAGRHQDVVRRPRARWEYGVATAVVTLVTAACWILSSYFHDLAPTNLVMLYLVGVVVVSLRLGRGPSMLASVLSVAAFDFCFIPPQLTFAVQDTQYLVTFAVMLGTALVISTLTNRVRFQAESARGRERQTAAFYALSRELTATQNREQIARVAVAHVAEAVECRVNLLLADPGREMRSVGDDPSEVALTPHDSGVVKWVLDHGQVAGRGTATLPGAEATYLPVMATRKVAAVMGIARTDGQPLESEQRQVLEGFTRLIGLALERAELAAEAERIRVAMETERLRSSLLSAVSHDLRTPLSVITGAASTLLESGDGIDGITAQTQAELLNSILDEAERLNRLVANLLDMTRLDAGAIEARRDWQSLEEIIGVAIQRVRRQLQGHEVAVSLPDDLPLVLLDELLMQQVFVNLLENAAKYSPAGGRIEIAARAEPQRLVVEVADEGPGVPADERTQVFNKFYRSSQTKSQPGAGLGLTICRGIVQLHGGEIVAADRSPRGLVIRIDLPLVDGVPPTAPPA